MVMGTVGIYTEMAKGEENGKRVSRLRWFALIATINDFSAGRLDVWPKR
jgi:hypothetical protein